MTMKIFILRHADAAPGEPDEARPLTERGFDTARQLGETLRSLNVMRPPRVVSSTLLRARQTAETLCQALGLPAFVETRSGLEPESSPLVTLRYLESLEEETLIVGHNPHLEALLSLTLTGNETDCPVHLKKTSLVCLEREGGSKTGWHWSLTWMMSPELLPPIAAPAFRPQ